MQGLKFSIYSPKAVGKANRTKLLQHPISYTNPPPFFSVLQRMYSFLKYVFLNTGLLLLKKKVSISVDFENIAFLR